ncbi:MAG TPA: tetratricopeptide repeat protein [Thermoanaerobaculia bacterium]|nr:tetratricopeptide repeat protein [Thermoanaerobaculia bacterium]
MRQRARGAVCAALGLVLALAGSRFAQAQKKIVCPGEETRFEISVKELAIQYEGWSLSGTLSSLSVLGTRLSVDPKTLQQAAAATQQWNELLKGLAAGWNGCILSKEQYAQGLQRIYPRLKEDGADLEKIRQLLAQGQQADEKRFKTLLDSYSANLRRFAEIGGQDVLLDRIAAVVERQLAQGTEQLVKGQEKILAELGDLKRKLETAPLPTPDAAKQALSRKLDEQARTANEAFQKGYDLYDRFRFEEAVPWFEKALATVKLHEFYVALGDALEQLGSDRAESVFRQGLALAKEEGSATHEGEMAFRLANLLLSKGDLNGALENARRAVETGEKAPGGDADPATGLAIRIGVLGDVLLARGDLDGALQADLRALRMADRVTPPEGQSLVEHQTNIAYLSINLSKILSARGDLDGALEHARRAARLSEESLGPEDLYTIVSVDNLGTILYAKGDYAGAREAMQRALAAAEKGFGADHPVVAERASNLAMILLQLGNLDGALESCRRALRIDERIFGLDDQRTAQRASNLGLILFARGDLDGALHAMERALATYEKVLGAEHPLVGRSAIYLAALRRDKGDLEGALAAAERALRIDEKTFGPEHGNVARDCQTLATVLLAKGDRAGALERGRRALRIDEAVFGSAHLNVARDCDTLGTLLLSQGDLDGAQQYAQRALGIAEKVLGPDLPKIALYDRSLGLALRQKGDLAAARTHFARALRILRQAYGPENPATRTAEKDLGETPPPGR